jgi:hypothetical protein
MLKSIVNMVAAATIVAVPTFAGAQTVAFSTSPVAVTAFHVNTSIEPGSPNLDVAPQFIAGSLSIDFVNKSGMPVKSVTFLISDGRNTQRIVDDGTFSPGVQIKHRFAADDSISAYGDATCKITEISFADGSAWRVAGSNVANR